MTLSIRPLSDVIGAEIRGLDLAEPVSDADFAEVEAALNCGHLLVFRDQARLTPAAHVAFSRRFGPLELHVQRKFLMPDHPELLIVSNEFRQGAPIGLVDAGQYWHSDLSYMAQPSLGSLLHAQRLPEEGGDTLFVNMHAAYDALPSAVKTRIAGLSAEHSYQQRNAAQAAKDPNRPQLDARQTASVPPVVHPVVRVHPGNGLPALFVNEGFTTRIIGLPDEEGSALLKLLFKHSVEGGFTYRHRWQPHDLVFWDNRSTLHLATGCPPGMARTMHRTTVKGDRPRGLM